VAEVREWDLPEGSPMGLPEGSPTEQPQGRINSWSGLQVHPQWQAAAPPWAVTPDSLFSMPLIGTHARSANSVIQGHVLLCHQLLGSTITSTPGTITSRTLQSGRGRDGTDGWGLPALGRLAPMGAAYGMKAPGRLPMYLLWPCC
jgi:hypothetical protein